MDLSDMTERAENQRADTWLSIDLATYIQDKYIPKAALDPNGFDADVLIVGSGYGGAVALNDLAGWGHDGKALRLLMLERGSEYLPGAFPSTMSDLAGHVRISGWKGGATRGNLGGLFDVRIGKDLNVLLANGLGGGSLINAGVMAEPHPSIFEEGWPQAIKADGSLMQAMQAMKKRLGAVESLTAPARQSALNRLAGGQPSQAAQVTMARQDEPANGIAACNGCGDCFTGCPYHAKLSVDVTLLADAKKRHPSSDLTIVTGATTLCIQPLCSNPDHGWEVTVVHTDEGLRKHSPEPYRLRTRYLILAAGSLGSSEILLRSKQQSPHLFPDIGRNCFSSNGDSLAVVHGMGASASAVADEAEAALTRRMGSTITRTIDMRDGNPDEDMVVQDLGVPASLRKLFEEVAATANTVYALERGDKSVHGAPGWRDPAAVSTDQTNACMLVALIGHDKADGTLRLAPGQPVNSGDGALEIDWPALKSDEGFDKRYERFIKMAREGYPRATVFANPLHRPLPPALEEIFGMTRGPLVSVHPLGGCRMADNGSQGVVNHLGQVFQGQGNEVYANLLVLDGAIVPTSLGINPALTIATLAHRSLCAMRPAWGLTPLSLRRDQTPLLPRPTFKPPTPREPAIPTRLELTERLPRDFMPDINGSPTPCHVEMALWFEPVEVSMLTGPGHPKLLRLDAERSVMTVWPKTSPACCTTTPSALEPILQAHLEGDMVWMAPARTTFWQRLWRGLRNWFVNRGLSDIVKFVQDAWRRVRGGNAARGEAKPLLQDLAKRAQGAIQLASHAGGMRLMAYRLAIAKVTLASRCDAAQWQGKEIKAIKRLTYSRPANLAQQIMRAQLQTFPMWVDRHRKRDLALDMAYFQQVDVPLVRIVSQQDQPTALADMASLMLYFTRAILPLHTWSLRLPDRPIKEASQGPSRRLPHPLPGFQEQCLLDVEDKTKAHIILSRYSPAKPTNEPPVLLIHGYSASGSTFAHELLPYGGLAGYLLGIGREVWIVDLRSSSANTGAQGEWKFEHMAYQDIPKAVDEIVRKANVPQIDIVAHCMGAAMLTLSLLSQVSDHALDIYQAQRLAMASQIRRLVFSQVGPVVRFSPTNAARAHLMQWLRYYIKPGSYEPTPRRPGAADDMLDRVFSLVPYPNGDAVIENPFWHPAQRNPWVVTRHRLDAFYGVTFKLANMSRAVLEQLDDFRGPFNLQTLAEVLNFSSTDTVTDHAGRSAARPSDIARVFKDIEVMSLHSTENGLVSLDTATLMRNRFHDAGVPLQCQCLPRMGHQDSLIGVRAAETFQHIGDFLARGALCGPLRIQAA